MNKVYRVIEIGTKKRLLIDFDEPKYELLSTFLESEVSNFSDWMKNKIDKVLSGEVNEQIISGNCCELEINRQTTRILDSLAEDGMGNWCEVDTKELRQLIDEWCEKEREFKRKQNI